MAAGLVVRSVSVDESSTRGLEAAYLAEMGTRYGDGGPPPLLAAEFEPPEGCFLVGFEAGEPVVCGGWRRRTDDVAEVKRMYVAPPARRRGFARVLLGAIERGARQAGYLELWLETGTEQPEALSLYRSAGYRPIPPYGEFRHDPRSRCFAKLLDDDAARVQAGEMRCSGDGNGLDRHAEG